LAEPSDELVVSAREKLICVAQEMNLSEKHGHKIASDGEHGHERYGSNACESYEYCDGPNYEDGYGSKACGGPIRL
jgi:hypothetical protein